MTRSDINHSTIDERYSSIKQILSVTADNVSNNNTMVGHLSELLDEFPGASNQTRCFAHTISLSAKVILKQFDMPKVKDGEALTKPPRLLPTWPLILISRNG